MREIRGSGAVLATSGNIKKLVGFGLKLRAGIIVMNENQQDLKETWEFLEGLGITNIGTDYTRKFGRAGECNSSDMKQLCGSCAGNILSIGPNSVVSPCNMSRGWPVGSVLTNNLKEIVASQQLADLRHQIGERP